MSISHGGGNGQSPSAAQLAIRKALQRVEAVVVQHFPEALDPLKAALAVAAVGFLKDNRQPTSLILTGRSGAGKTLVVTLITPRMDDAILAKHFYRSEKFTAASFVSNKADVSKALLKDIDLLPRLKDKTLLTKELSPVLSGNRDELMDRFAILTSVLDGLGFTTDSGSHGQHGYTEPINFQWVGASTPLQLEALEVMTQLGARLVFYACDRPEKDVDTLIALAGDPHCNEHFHECWAEVQAFLKTLYCHVPHGSIHSSEIAIPEPLLRFLVLWAKVLAKVRATVKWEKKSSHDHGDNKESMIHDMVAEQPERMVGILMNIARGSAVVHGRDAVDDYDLAQVAHIALSSGVAGRASVFRALLTSGGTATTPEIRKLSGLSTPTVLRYMKELGAVGLARFVKGTAAAPAVVGLREPFSELCGAPLLQAKRGDGEPNTA
jgi:hypothetical protein